MSHYGVIFCKQPLCEKGDWTQINISEHPTEHTPNETGYRTQYYHILQSPLIFH